MCIKGGGKVDLKEYLDQMSPERVKEFIEFGEKNVDKIESCRAGIIKAVEDIAMLALISFKKEYLENTMPPGYIVTSALSAIETVHAAVTTKRFLAIVIDRLHKKLEEVEIKVE